MRCLLVMVGPFTPNQTLRGTVTMIGFVTPSVVY